MIIEGSGGFLKPLVVSYDMYSFFSLGTGLHMYLSTVDLSLISDILQPLILVLSILQEYIYLLRPFVIYMSDTPVWQLRIG